MKSLLEIRKDLHRIPEPGFLEFKTQRYILDLISTFPQDHLEIHTWETGIFVKVIGRNASKTIAYRTDMDGLPISEETGYEFSSLHEGMMHACGHDVHMTIALGLVAHFAENPIDDHLLFIFQPAEEGPGGALPMRESELFKQLKPDMITALHIAPEYPVGTIAVKEGLLFANTSELFVDLIGKGGHAAYPHLSNDMVVAASHLVTQLQSIISRNIDPLDSAVVTIGKITGGTKQNIIAEKARLEGTIRTLSPEAMDKVKKRIEALVKGISGSFECETAIDYGSNYRQVDNEPILTREFMEFAKQQETVNVIECKEAMTGEDYGYFLEKIPGFMFWLGVDTQYGLHHSKLKPQAEAIQHAVDLLVQYFHFKGNRM
ncbi:N-acetyldiaminopimelate deacetylase [Fictibacillus sp. 5RED26]|uniref:N-acetyldiaminopimelate deacetylase n=1 Tax=unclassified Fictibacillus TaxID=2644029 RepID=UPI0018CFE317|nr:MULTISPECIES: N-acetyldiaminopimelate deacetylase [unclassified Fictibacillus]MBH0155708.1 N-acetyldiaminopimelate deacetylase [Fictibacillus sp. 5RED26]MBH0166050.1 N-acetyldiaminopimelate deacetylase [Fictibacillus sp. 7GRE50]